jgi:hypothetical protein
MRRKK